MSMSLERKLQIPRQIYLKLLAQAVSELPNECCGLLAGRDKRVTHRYPLVNALSSPTRYESDPKLMFAAFKDMREQGTELVAIYHSHPTSDPVPSRTDLERNFYGSSVIHLIISLKDTEPVMRAWLLEETTFREAEWTLDE
jgi:proteasome lid subunit RPN8/RPN11